MEDIKYSPNLDIKADSINDLVPERLIKVYPYLMPDASNSEKFIGEQTISVVNITQTGLDKNKLKIDGNNNYYFEILAAISVEGKLDYSSSTVTLGQTLLEEPSFTCISNWYYNNVLSKIKLGNFNLIPNIFSIGKPYNENLYLKGEQPIYISTSVIEAKEGRAQYLDDELDTDGLYEFDMINITNLESNFTNCKILFKMDMSQIFVDNDAIKIETEPGILINFVKAYSDFKTSNDTRWQKGFVDLFSKHGITPIKATPTSINDNLELYMDWFNYSNVMPLAFIKQFVTSSSINKVITTHPEDVNVIQHMLWVSAAFSDNFSRAPRYNKSEAKEAGGGAKEGDIKGDSFIIPKMKYIAIENKDPIKVVDSIYESHIRLDSDFAINEERQRQVKMFLSALSRYITSSYAIGKGQNSFNQVYLPWYLEPSKAIDYTDTNYDLLFVLRTNYFKSNFNSADNFEKGKDIILPIGFNISNQVYLNTDRPISLPQLPYTISEITKLQLAGDINIMTDNELKFLFYSPISTYDNMAKLYINDKEAIITTSKNEEKDYPQVQAFSEVIPQGSFRVSTFTQEEAKQWAENKYPGWTFKGNPVITSSKTSVTFNQNAISAKGDIVAPGYHVTYTYQDGSTKEVNNDLNWNPITPLQHAPVKKIPGIRYDYILESFTMINTIPRKLKSYTIGRRRLNFNKQEWYNFIQDYTLHGLDNFELEKTSDINISKIHEIIIGQVWADNMKITVGSGADCIINVPLFNSTDETIGVQKIIFT